jgi:RHS repeat-associated protein
LPSISAIFLTTLLFLFGSLFHAEGKLATQSAGNLQFTALWEYGWDAKNQLTRARTKNHNTAAQGYDITQAYDAEGRRFSKKVNRLENGTIVHQNHITYLHHGNDLIYERHQHPSGLTTLERKYLWGPDLSGTYGGAGGAGGLLLIHETRGNETIDLYPLYDGTGHVIALATLIEDVPTLVAEYAYGPFGELIHAKGPYAQSNPIRYATKYLDQETGLYNFGMRFLDPITGQFLSREPLGESESLNLYQYGHGDPINKVDVRGLAAVAIDDSLTTSSFGINALLGFSTNINAFDSDWWGKASETQRQTWEYLVADIETAKLTQAARELEEYRNQFTPIAVSSAFGRARMTADPDSYLFYRNSLELAAAENPFSYLTPARHDGGFIPYLDGAYDAGGEAGVYRAARPMQFLQGASNLSVEMSPLGAVSTLASAGGQFQGGHNLAGVGLIALAVLDAGVPGKIHSPKFSRTRTPWKRSVHQRFDIDWDLIRPDGISNSLAARRGYSPMRVNPTTGKWDDVVLHHLNDNPRGGIVEVWRSTHGRFHRQMSRGPNPWRSERPDWARAWNNEQSAYWRWRTGAYDPPPIDVFRLPGDP